MKIVLTWLPTSGKTSVWKILSNKLNIPFLMRIQFLKIIYEI